MGQQAPIGIFDSGVGGLSITHCIRRELPSENILYVADLRFSPYGEKSRDVIQNRSEHIADYFYKHGCKAMVVACNTATVNSISILREKFDIPIVGVEPGIKPAATQSKTGVIGVIATEQTLKSASFKALKKRFSGQVLIECQACPRLVELVESGDLNGEASINVVNDYIQPLLAKDADHIVLGCTHYSFLTPVIEQIVLEKAAIVDTAMPVARELKKRLTDLDLLEASSKVGEIQVSSTETSDYISEKVSRLLGHKVNVSEL